MALWRYGAAHTTMMPMVTFLCVSWNCTCCGALRAMTAYRSNELQEKLCNEMSHTLTRMALLFNSVMYGSIQVTAQGASQVKG
jgi:hypothetical protein